MGGIAVRSWFESSVNSYGNQTANVLEPCKIKFESSVNSYGNQTANVLEPCKIKFESSVNSYGNQTDYHTCN